MPRSRAKPTHVQRLAVTAEPLRAVEVRQALAAQPIQERGDDGLIADGWLADEDAKAIAVQMARTQFVGMPADAQNLDAVAFELRQVRLGAGGDGDHLPGHGVAILQSRGADLADRDIETARDLPGEVLSPHVPFFQPKIEEVAFSGGFVGGDFFDLEIFGAGFDLAAQTG